MKVKHTTDVVVDLEETDQFEDLGDLEEMTENWKERQEADEAVTVNESTVEVVDE
jgi:hypothetical protein